MSFELSRRTLLAGVGAGAVASMAWSPLRACAAPTSPVVNADRSVTFTYTSATAATVGLIGGWMPWPQVAAPLTPGAGGVWSVTVGPLAADWYSYHFVVDGVNTRDPDNPNPVPSSKSDCMFMVSGPATAFMEVRPVPHGTVKTLDYWSDVTDSTRQATVYTPPSYDTTKQYPLFVLMHGGGGDQWDWVVQGRANTILDNLIADRRIAPMVVVMPSVMLPGGLSAPLFSPRDDLVPGEILDNLIPAVEKKYNVFRAHTKRALAGLSMGGFYTWDTLLTRPGEFAWYGDFSSGWFPDGIANLRGADSDLFDNKKINTKTKLHAIYCDPTDIAWANNVETRAVFDDFGVNYTFTNQPGSQGHSWHTWRLNLLDFGPRIL